MVRFGLSELQVRAIVDMRLSQLTNIQQDKLRQEYQDLLVLIAKLEEILGNETLRMQIIKDELIEVKDKYGDDRRSGIVIS